MMSRQPEQNQASYGNALGMNELKHDESSTGKETMIVRMNPNMVTTSEKSSYHNPVLGISEKYSVETKQERRRSLSVQKRNREKSQQRKLRNLAYQDQLDSHQKPHHSMMNESAQRERVALSNVSNTLVQPTPTELGLHQRSKKTQKVETKGDRIITEQKLYFFDPVTGREENKVLRTEIKDPNFQNQPAKKQTYEHVIIETPNGPEEEIKATHREGTVFENIKNKLTNMMNHGI